ncbi:hypothetical protein [Streptomyces sp. IBSBF 2435]|uniref:hypothetical protein n=1 Tax=Streptomyces sp. IBSBF 2435 TaxID=2903531 RepID=UPI002FDBFD9B
MHGLHAMDQVRLGERHPRGARGGAGEDGEAVPGPDRLVQHPGVAAGMDSPTGQAPGAAPRRPSSGTAAPGASSHSASAR